MTKSKQLVFFGTEKFSTYALEALLAESWGVTAVVTKPDSHSGRGRQLHSPEVKKIASQHSIKVIQPENKDELVASLDKFNTEIAVLSAYGKIIPRQVLDHFKLGIVNIHPSLLPKHRGASPIEQTILDGDENAGVSLMKLAEEMDAGPVYAQSKLLLKDDENSAELYKSLGKLGSQLLIEKLPLIVEGKLELIGQDESLASYAPMISKSDGIIDWNDSAETIERKIRAYSLWPGSRTVLASMHVTVTKSHVVAGSGEAGTAFVDDGRLGVYCKSKSIIIDTLKPDGKREMSAKEFLAGNRLLA